jgi:hypothetical protein
MSEDRRLGWKEPAIVVGVLSLIVAVFAFGRDLTDYEINRDDDTRETTTQSTATLTATTQASTPTPTTTTVNAAEAKRRFLAAGNAACVDRHNQNLRIAQQVGMPANGNPDFATQMAFTEGSLEPADDLITTISGLERPPGDDQRIETMLGHLAQSNVTMRSAIDNYKRFGPQSPAFQQDLDEAAGLERKFNSAAAVYGLQKCA